MPTIIDALIVELGLDARDLETKAPKSTLALKKIEDQGNKTEKVVQGLSRAFTTLLSVIGGTVAIKAFVSDFIDANAQLDRFAKNIGLSVSTISAWSNATEKLGGSAQGLQGSLDMLSKSQTQLMLTGESGLIPYMSALGISLADVNGKARPVTDILLELSDRFSRMDRTTANNMGRMMGLDQGTMNLLLQGRKELELEIRRQKEQIAVTKAQAEEASRLQRGIVGLKQTFAVFAREMLMEAAPTIEKVLVLLQRFGDWCIQNKEAVGDFLKILAVGLAAIAVSALPIDLLVVGIVLLAAALALLWQDYQTWKRGGDSLIDWGKWEPGITAAKKGITALKDAIEDLLGWYDRWAIKSGNFEAGIQVFKDMLGIKDAPASTRLNEKQEDPSTAKVLSAEQIQSYFQKQGWSAAQAAGIAANIIGESSGNSTLSGDGGSAFGLAQWHSDRQAAFKKWSGVDIRQSTPQQQLGFVQYELTQGSEKAAGDALRKASSAYEAGSTVSQKYERPKDVAGNASARGSYAQTLMGIPGASSIASSAPSAGGGSATTVDKSIQTQIGTINVQTLATDAEGMVKDLEHSLDYLFASQFNFGLN